MRKRTVFVSIMLCLALLLCGCGGKTQQPAETAPYLLRAGNLSYSQEAFDYWYLGAQVLEENFDENLFALLGLPETALREDSAKLAFARWAALLTECEFADEERVSEMMAAYSVKDTQENRSSAEIYATIRAAQETVWEDVAVSEDEVRERFEKDQLEQITFAQEDLPEAQMRYLNDEWPMVLYVPAGIHRVQAIGFSSDSAMQSAWRSLMSGTDFEKCFKSSNKNPAFADADGAMQTMLLCNAQTENVIAMSVSGMTDPGQMTGPTTAGGMRFIAKWTEDIPEGTVPFEEAQEFVYQVITNEKQAEAWQTFTDETAAAVSVRWSNN